MKKRSANRQADKAFQSPPLFLLFAFIFSRKYSNSFSAPLLMLNPTRHKWEKKKRNIFNEKTL